jgi:hypothetical protein
MEELQELKLQSSLKKSKDDSDVKVSRSQLLESSGHSALGEFAESKRALIKQLSQLSMNVNESEVSKSEQLQLE